MTRFLQTAETAAKRAHAVSQDRGVLYVRRRSEERRTSFAASGSARLSGVVVNDPG